MPSTLLFAINTEGRVFGLSTNGTKWREFIYLGLEFKQLSAVPHFLWAIGGDRQVYVHVHGLDIPIRVKEEAYENERWTPFEGFSKRLLPTDRYHFSSQDGSKDRTLKKIKLPSMAWQWEGDWHLELTLDGQPLDDDGWTYAVDFPGTYYAKKQWTSCVRRRKWIRYRKYSALNSWCAIAPLHKDPTREPFIGVAIGGNELPGGTSGLMLVWAVTAHGRVMFRTGVSNVSPEGQRWTSIPTPSGCEVSQISVGPTGLVWAVLWNGKALVRTGITRACLTGEAWEEVGQPGDNLLLSQVSVGYNGLWAITRDNRVWFRKGISGDNCGVSVELSKGTGWVEMIGNMSSISVASNDQVWAVGAEDRLLYFRTAVTPDDLTGKTWRLIGAPTQLSRTSSSASLFSSGGQSGGTPKEKRHRSWTSLNRHSGSHENHPRIDLDLSETCHSAPAGSRNLSQKSTDGTSLTSYGSSDSGGLACSLQESNLGDLPHPSDIVEERTKDEEKENAVYEDTSHPVVAFSSKEITRPTRSWSPQSSGGTIVATEAHSAIGSIVFESDELAGIYSEHGEREEEDDDLYWADSEAFWASIEAGACLVNLSHLPNWFTENGNSVKTDLVKPWRIKILDELKMRPGEVSDLDKYEQAIDTSSWVKTANEKCLLPTSTFYQDCVLELEWVSGGKGSLDCGTLTISSSDKMSILDQMSMNDVIGVICSSIPGSPRISIFKSTLSVPLRIQFKAENDLEDWMTELSSVCCRVRNITGAPAPNSVWMTSALGDIFVCDLEHIAAEQQSDSSEGYAVDVLLPTPSVPFDIPLYSGFFPGSSVIIKGCVPAKAERFAIDFKCCNENGRSDIAFHFNPRLSDDVVIRNAKKNGVWGPEDRRGCQPFRVGAIFELKIEIDHKCFRVYVNNQKFVDFAVRESFSADDLQLTCPYITHLACSGDVVVNSVKYIASNLILPPQIMYWRQIPGHLRKVESAGGITWGIGFDNTAWVYMGRTERGASKNYKMSDSHCYYVYENQRWNPLTGYTSHGLPTDRFMWSDATGKHKRKREKTNLLSKKWHWANDWVVDYHTPGGVDKEGWQYAMDFPSTYHGKKHLTDYVRRRRWVRKATLDTEGPWTELGHTSLSDCSLYVDADQIVAWAVASNGYVLFRRGMSLSCPSGLSWEHVPSDHQIVSISCGPGKLWAIGKTGAAFWRLGITSSNLMGEAWNTVEAPAGTTLKQISVGQAGVWALDSNGRLSVRREETNAFPEGTHWETLPLYSPDQVFHDEYSLANTPVTSASGGFRYVSAKTRLWAITSSGQLVYRLGISPENPSGSMWIPGIECNSLHIS